MRKPAFFQTRARAVDHLGRGQIADCPTAITELWKNSHDAYATNASLHIFPADKPVAAIFDDGCGMTLDDILTRWLTIGTESKATSDVPIKDRFGLAKRPKLGEKGIGRLSAGFLAPVSLLVSKKVDSKFAVALVDWRFFENPFLLISDIQIPFDECETLDELPGLLPKLVTISRDNLNGKNALTKSDATRVRAAWKQFSEQERADEISPTTEKRIKELSASDLLPSEAMSHWRVARNEANHGTALFMANLNQELAVWVKDDEDSRSDEADKAKESLVRTLNGFIAPKCAAEREFEYHVEVHKENTTKIIIDSSSQLTTDYLRSLEHYLKGEVTEEGWFIGEVIAFGKPQGECEFSLNIPGLFDKKGRPKVGSFQIEIAAVEQDGKKSSHDKVDLASVKQRQATAGGVLMYRDGVRVLPYGRPDSDFFELEARRGSHAGREFWAHRRSFGRIHISRAENPNLKDKAGREGLVENQAKRIMKSMVIAVLKETARKYYGTASPIREKELARIQARKAKGKESTKAAKSIKRKEFFAKLRNSKAALRRIEKNVAAIEGECLAVVKTKDAVEISTVIDNVVELREAIEEIELPPLPKGLEDREEQYRELRDQRDDFLELLTDVESSLASRLASLKESTPEAIVEKFRRKRITTFDKKAKSVAKVLSEKLKELDQLWRERLLNGAVELDQQTKSVFDDVQSGELVTWAIEEIDFYAERLSTQLLDDGRSAVSAIDLLLQGVDVDSALTVSYEGEMSANDKIQQLYLLAQSGIAVELISHELESQARLTGQNLSRLPAEIRKKANFKRALTAFESLVDRFRFLAPLSVATYRSRRIITGKEISQYVFDFFERSFESAEIEFQASSSFNSINFSDVPSRIFPVFINLVNNSLYWLKFSKKKRRIRFDFRSGYAIIADSGPGVDEEDIDSLFLMFFTKRPQGRGIGLYLCKANLSVARHSISYATSSESKILPGANFLIEFRGIDANG